MEETENCAAEQTFYNMQHIAQWWRKN